MLCDFAAQFPEFVANLLDRDKSLSRNFREETITDLLLAALVPLRRYGVIADHSEEPTTGADLEIWFVDEISDSYLALLIQSKRLNCATTKWKTYSYRELAHPNGTGQQAKDLLTAKHWTGEELFPLYAFYNPGFACRAARAEGARRLAGVNLADGMTICHLVEQGVRVRNRSYKRLGTLHQHFFLFSDLFCNLGDSPLLTGPVAEEFIGRAIHLRLSGTALEVLRIPHPVSISAALAHEIEQTRMPDIATNPPRPIVRQRIPADIRYAILSAREVATKQAEPERPPRPRARIIFVSNLPPEISTTG